MEPPPNRSAAPAPLVGAALLWMSGIVAGRYLSIPPMVLWVAGLMALGIATATASRSHLAVLSKAALGGAIALTAAAACGIALRAAPRNHIVAFLHSDASHVATVTGRVASLPEIDAPEDGGEFQAYPRPAQTRFLLDAGSVSTATGPASCSGRIAVAVNGVDYRPMVGNRVRVAGRLRRVGPATNPGQWDPRRQARQTGIVARLTTPSEELVTVLDDSLSWPVRLVWRLRGLAAQRLGGTEADNRMLLRALVLGRRPQALRPTQEAMVRAGVAHFLSISGLHLGILLGFAYLLMRLGGIAPRSGATITLVLLIAYLLLVEPRTPVLRGAMMAGTFCLAVILGRSACTANLLAVAALVLLVADPVELFRPGFQLSFGTVAGILLFMEPVRRFLFGRWLNRRQLMVFGEHERLRRWWWRTGLGWTADVISVSVAAHLAALPLVAHHFGVITPLAPIASLLLLPLVAITLLAGYLHLLLTWWLPNLAGHVAGTLDGLVGLLSSFAHWLGRLPLCVDLFPVPIWAAMGLAAVITVTVHHRRLRLSRAWACVLSLAGALAFVGTTQLPRPARTAELAVLDVRHGVCGLLRTRSGQTFIFDAGSRDLSDPYRQVLAPYLRHRRWPRPTAAFISHGHIDHYNALPGLLDASPPSVVFVGPTFDHEVESDEHLGLFLRRLERSGVRRERLYRGGYVQLDDATSVTCLWPPPAGGGYDTLSPNEGSLVLRVDCDGVRILLPGDIEELGQQLLVELDPASLAADVLVLPHHGSFTPALDQFIEAVNPRIVIRSDGYRRTGAADQLRSLTVHRLFAATDRDGAIFVTCADGRARLATYASANP